MGPGWTAWRMTGAADKWRGYTGGPDKGRECGTGRDRENRDEWARMAFPRTGRDRDGIRGLAQLIVSAILIDMSVTLFPP